MARSLEKAPIVAPKKGTRSSGSFEQCSFCQRRRVRVVIVVKGPRQGHVTLPFLGGSRYALEHSPGRLGPALDRPLRPDRAERFSLWRARASGNEAVSEAGEAAASTNHGRPGGARSSPITSPSPTTWTAPRRPLAAPSASASPSSGTVGRHVVHPGLRGSGHRNVGPLAGSHRGAAGRAP